MRLHDVKPAKGARSSPKRVGRGMGTGQGRTAGRGDKGQKSRSGYSHKPGFEGGQMPLHRRLPKRGFTNIFRQAWTAINVERLGALPSGTEVTPGFLREQGLVPRGAKLIKILGTGDLFSALKVSAHRFSASATAKIRGAGGQIDIIPVPARGPKPRRRKSPGAAGKAGATGD